MYLLRAGLGNLINVAGRMNCALSLADRRISWVYPKILPLCKYEEEWLLLNYYLSTCFSCSFVLTRCCTLTWITKILVRVISNIHAGRIYPEAAGSQFLT